MVIQILTVVMDVNWVKLTCEDMKLLHDVLWRSYFESRTRMRTIT